MKARVRAWEVEDHCVPAIWTRREEADGSTTYDGIYTVTMKFDIIGNDQSVRDFVSGVKVGQPIKSLNFGEIKPKGRRQAVKGRMYVFNE